MSLILSILSVVPVYPEGSVHVGKPVSQLRPYSAGGR